MYAFDSYACSSKKVKNLSLNYTQAIKLRIQSSFDS